MDIRYFKMKHLGFTNNHYIVTCGDNTIAVREDGTIHNMCSGVQCYKQIDQFIPDSFPIEDRYINATDRPSVEGFKHDVEAW